MDFGIEDIIKIEVMKRQMEENKEKGLYFEIDAENTQILYNYITCLEKKILILCDD